METTEPVVCGSGPAPAALNVQAIYFGSDGDATKSLYDRLGAYGPAGAMAVNLFRANKCSARAKVYRGGVRGQGSYKQMAYDRKQWAMGNLCKVLAQHAAALGVAWGWKEDPRQEYHRWVLYVELPSGQVSFHTDRRGEGPIFAGDWDGVREAAAGRICQYIERLLEAPCPEQAPVEASVPSIVAPSPTLPESFAPTTRDASCVASCSEMLLPFAVESTPAMQKAG